MYEKLECLFPVIGCPLNFRSTFCTSSSPIGSTNEDVITRARKAEKIVQKEAKEKNAKALQEFSNKRRCIEFEQKERDRETSLPVKITRCTQKEKSASDRNHSLQEW